MENPDSKTSSVPARHWKFERRHHLEARSTGSCGGFAKREISCRASARRNSHFHRLLAPRSTTFMPGHHRVFSSGNTLDRIAAVLGADCIERMLQNADVCLQGGAPFGCDWFQSGLLLGVKCILCVVGSLFVIWMSWFTIAPRTCGR